MVLIYSHTGKAQGSSAESRYYISRGFIEISKKEDY